jgi:hypothetical protein
MVHMSFLTNYCFIPFQHLPFGKTHSNTKVNPVGCQAFFLISLDVPGGQLNEGGFYLIQVF